MKSLCVATCQFPVDADVARNCDWILKQIAHASAAGARLVHFSECALTGYAGVDLESIDQLDWPSIRHATQEIQAAAKRNKVWVLLGSTHFVSEKHRPHNCVYVIDSRGRIADRYDKRFCTGCEGKSAKFDLKFYAPGNRWTTFTVAGVRCGVAICYDYRFPEVGRAYKALGVEAMFYSFHNARKTVVDDPKYNIWKSLVPATMQCRAAENHFWISANNSTARPSLWGSFTVQPDGAIVQQLKVHQPGVLITQIRIDPKIFDATALCREHVLSGGLGTGTYVPHPRSENRTEL